VLVAPLTIQNLKRKTKGKKGTTSVGKNVFFFCHIGKHYYGHQILAIKNRKKISHFLKIIWGRGG